MANDTARRSYSFDASLQLKDAGLIAASAAATVGGVAQVLDLGLSMFAGVAVFNVTAIEVDTNNEVYDLRIELSNSSTFATNIQTAGVMRVGSAGGLGTNYLLSTIGFYELPFFNVQNDVVYRYARLYMVVAGTIATGINLTAYVGKMPMAAH